MDALAFAKEILEGIASHETEGEVYIDEKAESLVEVAKGKVEKLSHAASKGIGVRAFRSGRMGYAYTSDFSPQSAAKTLQAVLDLSRVADPDEYRSLPDLLPVPEDDLQIYDPIIASLDMAEKVAFALRVEQAALDFDPRVVATNMCTYMDEISNVSLANTRGFAANYQKTAAASFVFATARQEAAQGEAETTLGMGFGGSTHWADMNAESIGREAASIAVRLLGGKPVPTQRATVVFSPLIAAELVDALSQALTGEAMQRGRSFLVGKLGQSVAADNITLIDNGRLPRGLGSAPFDAEGVPTRASRLLDEGVLQAVVYDTYTARKDGRQSTGNARRASHRVVPSPGMTNFYLQPGNLLPEDIIAGVDNGLYVLNTMNVGGINPVSGDYSVAASGLWIENGQLTHPVNKVTIALPLGELLNQIKAIGCDLRFVPFFGAVGAPTIRVDGVVIGGES